MTREIELTKGKVCVVDEGDFEELIRFSWYAEPHGHTFYAARRSYPNRRKIYMHRHLLGLDGPNVDHRDGDGLNNRRENLRHATQTQNCANSRKRDGCSSRFRGVHLLRPGVWQAYIRTSVKHKYLGGFCDEVAAALVYDAAALSEFGEFARLNFPTEAV